MKNSLIEKIKKRLEKKLDIKKDHLRFVFNLEEKKYTLYQGLNPIKYEDINKQSKQELNKKNELLIKNPQLLMQELETAKIKQRFKKLKELGYPCDSFEYLGQAKGTMSKQMEELLTKLTAEENVLIGIHRIGDNDSKEKIQDIFLNGLEITGHLNGAAISSKELSNNVSYYPDNKTIIKELMYANHYKNSKGSILIRIPDKDLTQNIFIINKEGKTRINPKYIIGYVPLEANNHIETIILSQKESKQTSTNFTFKNNIIQSETFETENKRTIRK